jgi:Fe-Mn family superoxide dismutase
MIFIFRLCSSLFFPYEGHINHSLFWKNLAPAKEKGGEGGQLQPGPLKDAIDRDFGGLENLKKEFNAQTAAIQGSGWGWVGYNSKTKKLEYVSTANQDPLLCKSHCFSTSCVMHYCIIDC